MVQRWDGFATEKYSRGISRFVPTPTEMDSLANRTVENSHPPVHFDFRRRRQRRRAPSYCWPPLIVIGVFSAPYLFFNHSTMMLRKTLPGSTTRLAKAASSSSTTSASVGELTSALKNRDDCWQFMLSSAAILCELVTVSRHNTDGWW